QRRRREEQGMGRARRMMRTRLAAFTAVTATVIGVLLVAAGPAAQAAGGVWGVGQFPYSDGVICSSGASSTPLVSWPVGAGGSPGYLVGPISTDGVTDTGTPPSRGGTVSPLVPGQYGFTSAAVIARYAALLRLYQNAGPKATASLAELVREANGTSSVQCDGIALDRAYTATLLPAADQRVGPLAITMAPLSAAAIVVGSRVRISASVTSTSGAVAPGVPVSFSAPGASLSAATATTDPAGVATTIATINDVTRTAVPVQASVDSYTKLNVTTASGAVPAISLGAADTVSSTATIAVDQSAQPQVSATVEGAFRISDGVRASAMVTGMNAHSGVVNFAAVGPLPLLPATFCGTYDDAAFGAVPTVSTVDVPFTGDGTVNAPVRALAAPGCYASRVTVRTTNASPAATAVAARGNPTLGLDSAATLVMKHNGVGGGEAPLEGDVTVTRTFGIPASLTMSSVGPVTVQKEAGTCAAASFSSAARSPAGERTVIPGDGVYPAATTGVKVPGCYELAGTLELAVPGGPTLRVPFSTAGSEPVILAPGMAATATATSVSAAESTTAHIRVDGTYAHPAELYADLYYRPLGPNGACTKVDWATASVASTSKPLPITKDGEYDVVTGSTKEVGCYSITPRVVMRDNPAASFTTLAGNDNTVLTGGLGAARPDTLVPGQDSQLRAPYPGALVSTASLFGLAILFAGVIARSAFRRSWRRVESRSAGALAAWS
ncbi:MAG: hypothetical protein ABI251_06260, partial [Mycobacteriaceae bacterium]